MLKRESLRINAQVFNAVLDLCSLNHWLQGRSLKISRPGSCSLEKHCFGGRIIKIERRYGCESKEGNMGIIKDLAEINE